MFNHARYFAVKESTLNGLDRYAQNRIPTGDFLRAVLENDLMQAMGRADESNRAAMFSICGYVYNELPSACHGSPEKVKAWLKAREGGDA